MKNGHQIRKVLMVKKTFSKKKVLMLTEMDGNDFPNQTNTNAVKKYYI